MFRKLIKNKKAQNTAEYALLIALVVGAVIAMQTYVQRALQSRVRGASQFLNSQTTLLGASIQYEPYYLTTNYLINTNSVETQTFVGNSEVYKTVDDRKRDAGGFQESSYNTANTAGY